MFGKVCSANSGVFCVVCAPKGCLALFHDTPTLQSMSFGLAFSFSCCAHAVPQ
jgi:hypothetical protein